LAAAAAHHRLLWIHPFLDGNGRVARLMSHAMLLEALDTGAVWSVARGLARKVADYSNRRDAGNAIAVDAANNVYITGYTTSSNFPVTANALERNLVSGIDAFVTKLNHSGTALLYSTYLTGGKISQHAHYGRGIAVDSSANIYVTGSTNSPTFPVTTGVVQPKYAGDTDAFVSKIKPPAAP